MKVRFDGPLVLARSICGTRNNFQQVLTDKLQHDVAGKLRRAVVIRRST